MSEFIVVKVRWKGNVTSHINSHDWGKLEETKCSQLLSLNVLDMFEKKVQTEERNWK